MSLLTFLRPMTSIWMYRRKALLYYCPMIMIVSGYTMDWKSSMENPDRSEGVPNYLCENTRRSSPKESVPDTSGLIFIWDVMFVLWFYIHTVFTGVLHDVPGYDSSLAMISSQTNIVQRCFPVHYWVTFELLTWLFCVLNVGCTLYDRCIQPLLCSSFRFLMYNLMPPFHRMRFFLFPPLGVAEYSHDCIPKKRLPQLVVLWLCSGGSAVYCKCGTLACMGCTYSILWEGLMIFSPIVSSVG